MKTCTKCGNEYPATMEYFSTHKQTKDKLQSWCRKCVGKIQKDYQRHNRKRINEVKRKYRRQHLEKIIKQEKKYRQSLNGRLRSRFYNIKQRCNNSEHQSYKNYGGRGIKCLFKSANEFVDYVKSNLGIKNINQINGLAIDRIDNDGNYEPGNIRFVTYSENLKNKRKL